ncbi:MAG TPA: diguanylate cyclase [Baekduia sp.]|nr:diguanylate cyclase [Baekduia sp.]
MPVVDRSQHRAGRRDLLWAAGLGLAYAGLYKLVELVTAFGSEGAGSTFWPGAGLTVAVLLLRERRVWPVLLAAVGLSELLMDLQAGMGPAVSAGWALANTAEPALGAALLTAGGRAAPDLARRTDLARFVAFAVVAGPLLGALVGTATAVAFDNGLWWPRLPRWFVGDAIGALVVAPVVLVALSGRRRLPAGARARCSLCALVVVAGVALGPADFPGEAGLPFLVLPVLAVVAVTLRTAGAAFGVFLVASITEAVTAMGHGPFVHAGALDGLVVAQMFVAMSALTALTMAALMSDLVSREEMEQQLRDLALHDPLTGLANRRLLEDRLELACRRLHRRPGVLAVLFLDLDGFKAVNDTLGHEAGDRLLVQTAERLRAVVREEDTVARLGGDEFVVVTADLGSLPDAITLAARVVEAIDVPFDLDGGPAQVRASVGLATADGATADGGVLLRDADHAMYLAKRAGGGRVAVAEPEALGVRG